MIVAQKMFGYCGGVVSLFVNRSAMFVEAFFALRLVSSMSCL